MSLNYLVLTVDYGLAGSPDGMFTAGQPFDNNPTFLLLKPISLSQGPISESDFFTWEALICGPKDTPFVSNLKQQTRVLSDQLHLQNKN